MVYTLVFSPQNAICFIILTCLVPVLFTLYIQGVLKLKKNNSGAKRLKTHSPRSTHTHTHTHTHTTFSKVPAFFLRIPKGRMYTVWYMFFPGRRKKPLLLTSCSIVKKLHGALQIVCSLTHLSFIYHFLFHIQLLELKFLCLHRASMIIKHFIIQLMHNI